MNVWVKIYEAIVCHINTFGSRPRYVIVSPSMFLALKANETLFSMKKSVTFFHGMSLDGVDILQAQVPIEQIVTTDEALIDLSMVTPTHDKANPKFLAHPVDHPREQSFQFSLS